VRLVSLQIPQKVVGTFPGPAYGGSGVRALTHWAPSEAAFGTILKPTTGITADTVGALMEQVAACPLFLFVKEDENLYPRLDYSPVKDRARRAVESIKHQQDKRGGKGLIFAPHVTGAPHEILESIHAVLEAGVGAVMFSESFAGGSVRMVREATKHLTQPPAIYGHNAGIGVRTRGGIWREVIDFLARIDGIDFRQTAPLREGTPFIYPYGDEWLASERILTTPIPGIRPTMIARAGGLDQGNIILNLEDADQRGLSEHILFLAGSAINSIKDASGKPNAKLGAEAMQQALEIYRERKLHGAAMKEHLAALIDLAERERLGALREALRQRYPDPG
jgi:ribulose 1,5-bisphosphate carboxylase large subunit-like protein